MKNCFLIVEHFDNQIRPISYELASAADRLSESGEISVSAVVLGRAAEALARQFSSRTGIETFAIETTEKETSTAEISKLWLREFFKVHPFDILLAGHTIQGLDILPALAVQFKTSCLTAIESLEFRDDRLAFQRTLFNGKLRADFVSLTSKTMLTIQPGSFPLEDKSSEPKVQKIALSIDLQTICVKHLKTKKVEMDNTALKEASVIVAAGRGIESEDNLEWVYKFANLFPRSAVAGSRPLCDLGWLSYNQQVGITGATVGPDLYIACGVSGTSQHTTGMKGSGYVVAINKDKNSAMFRVADVCVVEDLISFIPLLIETYQRKKQGG